MTMTDRLRAALRIKSTAFNDEVSDLLDACKADLADAGVSFNENDPLHRQAAIFYGKANFGFNGEECDKYQDRYERLKASMSHSTRKTGGDDG